MEIMFIIPGGLLPAVFLLWWFVLLVYLVSMLPGDGV